MELEISLERCKKSLTDSVKELKGDLNESEIKELEKIAKMIIHSMTGAWRFFHTPEHIFEVGGNGDPIEIISALFHDMIYVQVDHGININLSGFVFPYVRESDNQLFILHEPDLQKDNVIFLLLHLFGFQPGQVLSPFAGQNEFLSALIALKSLENILSEPDLVQIGACIETTIPFRKKNEKGESSHDLLKKRLILLSEERRYGWNEEQVDHIITRCVRMANRDVENFASPNPIKFLDNTWNLMPETNHELGSPNMYTIMGYRTSMMKMEGFMHMVYPQIIFHQFKNEPSDERLQELYKNTERNLEVAKLYIGSKLLTVAILEALSHRIGKSVTLATFIGELPTNGMPTITLDLFLPKLEKPFAPRNSLEENVLEILIYGRNQDSPYDLKNSPIATFLVQALGFDEIRKLLVISKDFFAGKMNAEDFLKHCSPFVLDCLIQGVLKLFENKINNLQKVKQAIL